MNIRDAQDSFSEGRKRWEKFISGMEMRWNAPVMLEDMVLSLRAIPPEVFNRLPADTQARLGKMIGGKNAR